MVDFMLEVFIDNSLDKVVVEADAKVSVCGGKSCKEMASLKEKFESNLIKATQ